MSVEATNTQDNKHAGLWCLGSMFTVAAGGAALAIWVLPPTIEAARKAADPALSAVSQTYTDTVRRIAPDYP